MGTPDMLVLFNGKSEEQESDSGSGTAAKTLAQQIIGHSSENPPEEQQKQKKPQPSRMGPLMKRG